MSITLTQSIVASSECMTNEDAIAFITQHVSPSDLVELLSEPHDYKLIPGCGYTKAMLRRKVNDDG